MDALRGIALVTRTPRLWPLCLGPLAGAFTLYIALGVLGGWLIVPRLPGWLGQAGGAEQSTWITEVSGSIVFVILWALVFNFVFVLLAGMFSGLIWDRLSLAVEEQEAARGKGVVPPPIRLGCGAQAKDSLARLALAGTLGVLAFALGCVLGPVPGVVAAALVGLLDYSAPAYLRRGHTLGAQWARLRRGSDAKNAFSFALVAGLVSLVPVAGVLLAPGLVAGGTLLVRRRESA